MTCSVPPSVDRDSGRGWGDGEGRMRLADGAKPLGPLTSHQEEKREEESNTHFLISCQ